VRAVGLSEYLDRIEIFEVDSSSVAVDVTGR
jgi:hypothetical protein